MDDRLPGPSPYTPTACDAWNADEKLDDLLPAAEPPEEDELDVTDRTVAEVLSILEKHGTAPENARLEYAGCGTHALMLVLIDPKAVPKKLPPYRLGLPPRDAYRFIDDGITDPNMLDLPEEPIR